MATTKAVKKNETFFAVNTGNYFGSGLPDLRKKIENYRELDGVTLFDSLNALKRAAEEDDIEIYDDDEVFAYELKLVKTYKLSKGGVTVTEVK